MSGITLSSAMRSNLLSLQSTVKQMDMTQVRLSTGKEVNQALDSPYRYFTSNLLQARADDLDTLNHDLNLSSKTIQAATNGMEAMRELLDQAKSLLQQSLAESDGFQRINFLNQYNEVLKQVENTAEDSGYKGKNLLGGSGNDLRVLFNEEYTSQLLVDAVDYTKVSNLGLDKNMYQGDNGVDTVAFTGDTSGTATTIPTFALDTKMVDIVSNVNGNIPTVSQFAVGDEIEFAGLAGNDVYGKIEITDSMTVDEFLTSINVSVDNVTAKLSATGGGIDFTYASEIAIRHLKEPSTALSGAELNAGLGGINAGTLTTSGGTGAAQQITPATDLAGLDTFDITSGQSITLGSANYGSATFTYGVDGTTVQDFMDYMNENANGIQLFIDENGAGTADSIGIHTKLDAGDITMSSTAATPALFTFATAAVGGAPTTATGNEIVAESDFFSDSKLNSLLLRVRSAELDVRQQITSYSTDLTLIQRRMDFSEMMINTLELGATDLVIADTNEEGANMLTLQTRQQLSNTALSLAAQAEQGVLRLFG